MDFDRVARGLLLRRQKALIALSVCAGVCGLGALRLSARFNPQDLVPMGDEAAELITSTEQIFGPSEEPILVVLEAPHVLHDRALDTLHRLTRSIERHAFVRRVDGLTTIPYPHAAAHRPETLEELATVLDDDVAQNEADRLQHALMRLVESTPAAFPRGLMSIAAHVGGRLESTALVAGETPTESERDTVRQAASTSRLLSKMLLSADRKHTLLAVHLETSDEAQRSRAVDALETMIAGFRLPASMHVHVTGLAQMRRSLQKTLLSEPIKLACLSALGSIAILLLGFQSAAGVLLPLAASGLTLSFVMGLMGWTGVPIDLVNNIVPPLLITVGLSDAVHLLTRFYEEQGRPSVEAAITTMKKMALACLITSVTTAIGFASLWTSRTATLHNLGTLAAGGVMVGYVITVLFIPAALLQVGQKRSANSIKRDRFRLAAYCARIADVSRRYRFSVLVVSLLILLVCWGTGRNVSMESKLLDQFDEHTATSEAATLIDREFGGIRRLEVRLDANAGTFLSTQGMQALEHFSQKLEADPLRPRVLGPHDWIEEAWTVLHGKSSVASPFQNSEQIKALYDLLGGAESIQSRFVSADGSHSRLTIHLPDVGQSEVMQLVTKIRQMEINLHGAQTRVFGEAYQTSIGLQMVVEDLAFGFLIAVLVVFAVLTLLFRSLTLGALSLLPNLAPLAVTLAWMSWRQIPAGASTVIVFAVTLGLAVDGTIHLITRFREELRAPSDDPLKSTFRGSGPAVVLSSATLVLGFAALSTSSFVPIRLFGELSTVAIATALIAELVLLPASLSFYTPKRRAI
ncbi:MAG: MMPL family transporter [Myxococcota bacterium]